MKQGDDLDVDVVLASLEASHANEVPDPDEGLRERKKRRVRQRISDVATAMFLVHGFDKVTVAQIAAVCEVSPQTVFNYFPTKESILFDRFGSRISAVADAVRDRGSIPLVESVVQALAGENHAGQRGHLDEARQLHLLRLLFSASGSPSLAGARLADFARFTEEVADALAERVGAKALDPEVQIAAFVIAGLVRVRQQSTFTHVQDATSLASLGHAIRSDVLKAAQLAEPTLTAFDSSWLEAARTD